MSKNKGFTLAEIFVTLAIIGIIASLTIPALIENTQKAETVSQLKKDYSALTQAYNMIIADGGDMDVIFADNNSVLNAFAPKLNIAKICGYGQGCFPNVMYKWLNGNNYSNRDQVSLPKAMLSDGTSILFWTNGLGCTQNFGSGPMGNIDCGTIGIDINGFKGPNQMGRDYFEFDVTSEGIFPIGEYNGGTCDLSNPSEQGWGCGARILKEGAVNY